MDVTGFALVVGAGSGIGLETALTFAERGARGIAFVDKNLDAAQQACELSKSLATAADYHTIAVQVDVVDRNAVRDMVKHVHQLFGRIDYAVNSAGVGKDVDADVVDVAGEEFDKLHDINCKGILHCLQEEIKVMQNQVPLFATGRSGDRSIGPGAIINVTSLSSLVGSPKAVTYTASKFAARAVIKCAAIETRKSGLRINEICPGYTDTPMLQRGLKRNPKIADLIAQGMPLGRVAKVEEIAQTVCFLASPAVSFINGQSIVVDSGVSIAVVG